MTIQEGNRLFFKDNYIWQFNGDARSMYELPDESVQCVITSPPYWGLRKYKGNQDLIWGNDYFDHDWQKQLVKHDNLRYRGEHSIVGNERNPDIHPIKSWKDCQHEWLAERTKRANASGGHDSKKLQARHSVDNFQESVEYYDRASYSNLCALCAAWRGAYGLEPTPEMYVQHTVELLREIRRVLRPDGVVFWNIGDSYWGSQQGYGTKNPTPKQASNAGTLDTILSKREPLSKGTHPILKPKDMCLIPQRLAIACQDDGWWVRSTIVWNKLNPMPESVRDRPTESQEYILMLTKSANYYWDLENVREAYIEPLNRWGGKEFRNSSHKYIDMGGHDGEQHFGATSMYREGRLVRPHSNGRNLRSVWTFPTEAYDLNMCEDCGRIYKKAQFKKLLSVKANHKCHCSEENEDYSPDWDMSLVDDDFLGMRCNLCGEVYTMKEFDKLPKATVRICVCGSNNWLSHFAVFPEKLPELCIKAATPEVGCCSKCGKPWVRIIEHKNMEISRTDWGDKAGNRTASSGTMISPSETTTLGWQPQCNCNKEHTCLNCETNSVCQIKEAKTPLEMGCGKWTPSKPIASIVLDPFSGSGTTLWVSKRLGRRAVGDDLSKEYCELSRYRNQQGVLV